MVIFVSRVDSDMLRYAYAELEESRGAIQVLKLALFSFHQSNFLEIVLDRV